MTIDLREAATSLDDIAAVERRTREAVFYGGSGTILIVWGVLVVCGYALAELLPRSARLSWLAVSVAGGVATLAIIRWRMRARPKARRDGRFAAAMLAFVAFGAGWSYAFAPFVPRPLMYAFQPSFFLMGLILMGLWLGRQLVVLALLGLALIGLGYVAPEPMLRPWMVAVQSGTLILGGMWLLRSGLRP